jgi:mannose-6-phosphate isomerase-like protein (cupin superfamily)
MELDGERRTIGAGDAILIPSGAWHTITATKPLRFLCCCAPPYAHEERIWNNRLRHGFGR